MVDQWLRSKTFVQIVALVLAILLWAMVHLEQKSASPGSNINPIDSQTVIFSDVKIAVIGLDEEHYHIRSIDPKYVNVTVSGRTSQLRELDKRFLNSDIVLDLKGLEAGSHQQVQLRAEGYPDGLDIDIDPANVSVVLENIRQKEVPVEVIVQGEPREGFRAGDVIVQPSRVHVAVPESQVDEIIKVQTIVNISNANEGIVTERKLVAVDRNGKEVEVSIQPSVAEITIPITSPFKTIPLQIKFSGEVPAGLAIAEFDQSVERVTIYGAESTIEPFDFYKGIDLHLSNLNRAQNYTYTYSIPLQNQIHQVLPEKVDVRLKVVKSEKLTLENFPITLVGRNEEVITEINVPNDGQFDLVVEGAPELLKDMTTSDIQAVVDVSNLPPGEYTKEIQLHLPRFIKYGGAHELLEAKINIAIADDDNEDKQEQDNEEGSSDKETPDQPVAGTEGEEGSDEEEDEKPADREEDSTDDDSGDAQQPDEQQEEKTSSDTT